MKARVSIKLDDYFATTQHMVVCIPGKGLWLGSLDGYLWRGEGGGNALGCVDPVDPLV